MKKCIVIASLLAAVLAVSCVKEESPYVATDDGVTRYTVYGQVPALAADLIATATVYEYNASDVRVDSNIITNPSSGTKYVYEPSDSTTHLKLKLVSKEETYRWGDTIVMIKPGYNVDITISITSPTTKFEPMLQQ